MYSSDTTRQLIVECIAGYRLLTDPKELTEEILSHRAKVARNNRKYGPSSGKRLVILSPYADTNMTPLTAEQVDGNNYISCVFYSVCYLFCWYSCSLTAI